MDNRLIKNKKLLCDLLEKEKNYGDKDSGTEEGKI